MSPFQGGFCRDSGDDDVGFGSICSAHQTLSPNCEMCNPALAGALYNARDRIKELATEVERLKAEVNKWRYKAEGYQ